MPNEQLLSARQGGAYNPVTHFTLMPIFVANFIFTIVVAARSHERPILHWWLAVIALMFLLLTAQQRGYSLRVQDRVIRLEERMRIGALVPGANVSALSMQQLIALRFASDAELAGLVARTIGENLDPKTIKESIVTWRADEIRI